MTDHLFSIFRVAVGPDRYIHIRPGEGGRWGADGAVYDAVLIDALFDARRRSPNEKGGQKEEED